jgi:hypothetical protein
MAVNYHIWGTTCVPWKQACWKWSECSTTEEILQPFGVDATTLIQPWLEEPWNPYRAGESHKKRKLIKLICKIRGEKYEEEKMMKNFTVTADDVKLVVKAISNIDLDLKMEE